MDRMDRIRPKPLILIQPYSINPLPSARRCGVKEVRLYPDNPVHPCQLNQLFLYLRPDTHVGEYFEEDGMPDTAVDDVGLPDAVTQRVGTAGHLGNHPAGDGLLLDEPV